VKTKDRVKMSNDDFPDILIVHSIITNSRQYKSDDLTKIPKDTIIGHIYFNEKGDSVQIKALSSTKMVGQVEQNNKIVKFLNAVDKFDPVFEGKRRNDYSKVLFTRLSDKICIPCEKHNNIIIQKAIDYVTGMFACLICSTERRKATNILQYGVEYASQSEEVKAKMKATNLARRGVKYSGQSEEVREKMKATMIKRHGVEYAFQSEEVKAKMKETNLLRRGVEYAFQSEEVKEKRKTTMLLKYGVEHPLQSEEVKEKRKTTMLLKYGVEHPLQSEEIKAHFKATCQERYGENYPMQNPEIFEKQQKAVFKFKEYIFPSKTIGKCQGYEPFALDILVKKYPENLITIGAEHVPHFTYDTTHRYFPDILISTLNQRLIIEVKSVWTYNQHLEKNHLKFKAVLEAGYELQLWIYHPKIKKMEIQEGNLIDGKLEMSFTSILSCKKDVKLIDNKLELLGN
jgi:hypothetical protein